MLTLNHGQWVRIIGEGKFLPPPARASLTGDVQVMNAGTDIRHTER
jgi:hypothetical protein